MKKICYSSVLLFFFISVFSPVYAQSDEIVMKGITPIYYPKNLPTEERLPIIEVRKSRLGINFDTLGFIRYNKYEDKVYICDTNNGVIWVYDTDLNFIKGIKNYGQGPGEFTHPTGIDFYKDGRGVFFDFLSMRVLLYDKNFTFNSQFKTAPSGTWNTVCMDSKGRIYLHLRMNYQEFNKLITVKNFDGDTINEFGETFEYKNEDPSHEKVFKFSYNKITFALDEDDNIYCGFNEHPIVRKYDKNGNLVFDADFSNFPSISRVLNQWERKRRRDKEAYWTKGFISLISVDKEYMYIEFNDFFNNESKSQFYVLDKENAEVVKKLEFKVNYNKGLSEPNYMVFDASPSNYIYAICHNGAIAKFKK